MSTFSLLVSKTVSRIASAFGVREHIQTNPRDIFSDQVLKEEVTRLSASITGLETNFRKRNYDGVKRCILSMNDVIRRINHKPFEIYLKKISDSISVISLRIQLHEKDKITEKELKQTIENTIHSIKQNLKKIS